ncbi:MAG: ABC transporter ATP-binding protein [Proteobacteria bacterium]|nr:ABC transporter ATP-binding protein [Pseudomonadota bacterium]
MMDRIRFLLHYFSIHKFSYFLGIVFIVLTNWISVSIPGYLKLCIDLISEGIHNLQKNQDQLFEYLMIMLALAVSIIVVRTLSRIFFFNPGRAIEYRIKNDLFRKLTLLQKDYYDRNPTGSIISKIQNDINGVRMICGFGMMQLFNIVTALSLTPYKMWQLSPSLTLYTVIPIVFVFVLVRIGMHYVIRYTRTRMTALQQMSTFIVSSLSGIDVIKNFDMKPWSVGQFDEHNRELRNLSIRISFIRSFIMPVLQNLENILKVLILLVGGIYVINAGFTIGDLTAFIAYGALLTLPIMGLGWLTTIFETGMVGIASLQTIMNQEIPAAEVDRLPETEIPSLFDRGLEVKNLTFNYPGHEEPVLKNVSFKILPNQTVGILGKIGSGKTTLVNCLNRYLPVEADHIFLGGRDISRMAFSDVRSVIRTVSQDVFLFSESIEKNIVFGSRKETEVTSEQLDRIIYNSALEDEINHFSDKIKTIVGEKGIMLSGGQKQRISLARAMMAPFDLLVLDNVLSAVDYETERFLLKNILERKTARSLLIVSHRVQALETADLILVFENGTISEKGTHRELIARPGLYRDTWELQNDTDGQQRQPTG